MTMEANLNFILKPYVNHLGSSVCQPVSGPQVSAILEQVHQVITTMLCTAELDMAKTVVTSDKDVFLTDAACAFA